MGVLVEKKELNQFGQGGGNGDSPELIKGGR